MVSPSATSASATPMISASMNWGSTTKWRYASRSSIGPLVHYRSELVALVGADRLWPRDLADGLEVAALHLDHDHVDDRLVVALAHLLRALRRFPGGVLHRGAQLVGVGAADLLDRLLEQIEQPVGVGGEQVRIVLEFLLERGDELLVARRVDVGRIAGGAEKALARAAHGADILLGHGAGRAGERQLVIEDAVFLEL